MITGWAGERVSSLSHVCLTFGPGGTILPCLCMCSFGLWIMALAWLLHLLRIRVDVCSGRGKQSVYVQVTKENIVKLFKHTQAETI